MKEPVNILKYTADKSRKETEEFLRKRKEAEAKVIKQLPKPTIDKPQKKKKKYIKGFFLILIGVIIGGLIVAGLSYDIVKSNCEPVVTKASKIYYSMGVNYIVNYINDKNVFPYIENGDIKEISLVDKCKSIS